MRWLSLLLLLSLTASAEDRRGRFERFCGRSAQGRSSRGFLCDDYAFFEAFPASGAGTTTACSTTPPTGAKGETLTFSRSTSAWCSNDDYSLTLLSANQPRVMRGRGPSAPLALLVEETAGQNDVLHNRDGSQAAWTKTSATCAKTAAGVDGVASSASTCTATAGNGTVLQAIVRASAANATSLYIRRRTGTGTVEVTRDNGTTWNAITTRLTSDWKRVVCLDTEGCMGGRCIVVPDMCATSTNPTVGFRLVTSGDAVDFDLAQNESRNRPSSPITTAGTAETRGAESSPYFTLPTAANFGSLSASVLNPLGTAGTAPVATWQSNTNFSLMWYSGSAVESAQDLGCAYRPTSGLVSVGSSTFHPGAGFAPISCNTTRRVCTAGQCATAVAGDAITAQTRIYVGASVLSGQAFNGMVGQICFDSDPTRCGPDRTSAWERGIHIAWLGDSITFGSVSAPTRPPYSLQKALSQATNSTSRMVFNAGFGGDTVAAMKVRWDSYISAQGWGTLVFLGGVNDLRVGTSAASTYATAAQILDDARARGMAVVVVGILPWANYVGWSAAKQTETDSYNTLLSAWATANGQTFISTASMGTGSPLALQAGYDSGDGLHPNAAGSAQLATLVQAAFP